jgi:hypothetical protein
VCVSRDRRCAAFRFVTDGLSSGTIWCQPASRALPAVRRDIGAAGPEHHVVLGGLVPEASYGCAYGAYAGAGAGGVLWTGELDPVRDVDGPLISEVLLNPAGSEPSQEYVEVLNPGPAPVDLGLYRISDVDPAALEDPASAGDAIPAGTMLGAGAVALIVPSGFLTSGPDPSPSPGCLLVRIEGSLATSGLRNSGGEPVYLVDGAGEVVSLYPNTLGTTGQGMSAHRVSLAAPDGDPVNWIEAEPSPGIGP